MRSNHEGWEMIRYRSVVRRSEHCIDGCKERGSVRGLKQDEGEGTTREGEEREDEPAIVKDQRDREQERRRRGEKRERARVPKVQRFLGRVV